MTIFAGSSNKPLAEDLAKTTGIELGKIELSRFTNKETKVYIENDCPKSAVIVQSFSNPSDRHIIEFCLIADALKRMGCNDITAVVPYLGYSKQDKVFRRGEPLSVKVIANIMQTTPIKEVVTCDLHNPAIMGFFDIPLHNMRALPLFVDYFTKKIGDQKFFVVSPDAGAVKASTEFASALGVPIAYINKKRNLETGEVSIIDIDRDVDGANIIIIDDMIASGSTMLSIAAFLKTKKVQTITIGATHHLYLDGVQEKLDNSTIDNVVVTNSIQKPDSIKSNKLSIIHLESLLASTIV